MSKYKLILFDCDGTLVDSEYLNNQALVAVLHSFGLTQYTIDYALHNFTGLRFRNIAEMVTDQTGITIPENARDLYLEKVRELAPKYLKPIDGARALVEYARKHFEICVVSNGERNNVLNALSRAGICKLFEDDFIFTGLMAANPKPAPDLFLLAAQSKNIAPEEALVIEDSIVGVRAGISAGMDVWGFQNAHDNAYRQRLCEAGAKEIFRSMEEMRNALSCG